MKSMERKEKQERKGKDLSKKYKDLRYNFHIFFFMRWATVTTLSHNVNIYMCVW